MKRTARVTGVLYLLVIILAGFSEGFVRSSLIVTGDAAATASNIMASEGLFRLGFATDLIAFMCDAAIAMLFYVLLKPAGKTIALVAAAFRLLAHPAIAAVNLLNHFVVLPLLSGSAYLSGFGQEQLNGLAMLFLDLHGYGYLIGGAFFGVHLFLLGYLLYKSNLFPSIFGVFMIIAAFGYLTESFGDFLLPGNETLFAWFVAVPAVIAEFSLTLWLLIKGVKEPVHN